MLPGACKATSAKEAVPVAVALSRPAAAAAAAGSAQDMVRLAGVRDCSPRALMAATAAVKARSSVSGTVAVLMVVLVALSKTRSSRLSWKVAAVLVATKRGNWMVVLLKEDDINTGPAGPGAAPVTVTAMLVLLHLMLPPQALLLLTLASNTPKPEPLMVSSTPPKKAVRTGTTLRLTDRGTTSGRVAPPAGMLAAPAPATVTVTSAGPAVRSGRRHVMLPPSADTDCTKHLTPPMRMVMLLLLLVSKLPFSCSVPPAMFPPGPGMTLVAVMTGVSQLLA